MNYLAPADLIVIHEMLIAEFGGMRGITEAGFGRLEAAAATPQVSVFGADIYADLPGKAAALCDAIVRAHPFSDGNKRVALVALDLFLSGGEEPLWQLAVASGGVFAGGLLVLKLLRAQTHAR